jgi:hypothetical protein
MKSHFVIAASTTFFQGLFLWTRLQAAPLLPHDVNILLPIKGNPAADTLFQMEGTGLCNAPPVHEFLPPPLFEGIAGVAFGSKQGSCTADTALEDKFFLTPDAELLRSTIPLAQLKGLAPKACDGKNWKVVGIRYDGCANLPYPISADKRSSCLREFRLSVQPFEKQENGLFFVRDFTMHLIYKVPNEQSLVADLKTFAQVSREVEKTKAWKNSFDNKKEVFRPHFALRNEMNSCNGKASSALLAFLKKHATLGNLSNAAWMNSSLGVKEWTFGVVGIKNAASPNPQFSRSTPLGQSFDNFSDTLFLEGKPSGNSFSTASGVGFFHTSAELSLAAQQKLPAQENSPQKRTQHLDEVLRVLNPTKISQFQANCTTCHLAPQVLGRLRELYSAPTAVGSGEFALEVWPPFVKRSFTNLHNFSYGTNFQLGVNRRTLNEIKTVTEDLNSRYPN